jgi:L-aspartate oxidase
VYLDATEAVGLEFPRRFPSVWRESVQSGIDPRSAALPVTPAEHYFMGGIATDSSGRTSLPGLWAVGEVAGTGLHGANRLASNSLLEAMVLGAAASRSVLASDLPRAAFARLEVPADALRVQHASDNTWTRAIRALMWERVGLVRDAHGLAAAIAELERLQMRDRQTECSFAERNLLLVARLIATAALSRQESRGAHWRADCPQAKPELARRSFVRPRRARPTLLRALARRAA